MLINSRHNERVKHIVSLKQKKYRDRFGEYIVEGIKMVREAFTFGKTVKAVFGLEQIVEQFKGQNVEVFSVTQEILEVISDAMTPQGVVAILQKDEEIPENVNGISVCLDGVSDAGNLGTILRICSALAIKNVFLINCVDVYSPKVVRSSMSGIYLTKTLNVSADEFIERFTGKAVIVADMDGEDVFSAEISGDFCLLLGSEAHGVSAKMKEIATKTLKIPMKQNLESLNVGVSAGIILYQLLKNTL